MSQQPHPSGLDKGGPFDPPAADKAARRRDRSQLLIAAGAAFCTYFCMYAFRKPFTAATFEGQQLFGFGLKSTLVVSQLIGYMLSKFLGIKVISEMSREHRAITIVGLIAAAEVALIGLAWAPPTLKPAMMFLNGLPLGMVFGLVLAYLEGRRQTEALSAALCASFIVSSGVVKSVGRWLIEDFGVSEFSMPMLTGAIFLIPLLISVWMLNKTPPPGAIDRELRFERSVMRRPERQRFLSIYWPGLTLLILVYVALTVVRTIRDDFGVEIWRDLGVESAPSVFARSETLVGVLVTALNALTILITGNMLAIRVTVMLMCASFGLVGAAAMLQSADSVAPFAFMVACGVGLYVPYVAFHTTVFERLIAVSRRPCNLGFLMYLADAIGYLGYAAVLILRTRLDPASAVLPMFLTAILATAVLSVFALLAAMFWFQRAIAAESAAKGPQPETMVAT